MTDTPNLHAIAHDLRVAQDARMTVAPLTGRHPRFDNAAAYEVSRLIHEARLAGGARHVGRKIGFTNRNIWPQYGVYEPIWAPMYATTVQRFAANAGTCALEPFAEPRIEPEIVLHFARAPAAGTTPTALLDCIDWIAHGFEIVQSHFAGWRFQVADTIADSGLHGTLLIGDPVPVSALGADLPQRLSGFGVALACNGQVQDRGTGANVLDGPLQACAYFLDLLAKQPRMPALAAGEIVTTGTLTAALPVRAGETWSTTFEGIGLPGLTVRFDR